MQNQEIPYQNLNPDTILAAVESTGVECTGQLLALNSYENRVYQVGIEGAAPLIVKFYRPGRWTNAAIDEEHQFVRELYARDIPVVVPISDNQNRSLHDYLGYRFALYLRKGGRLPELDQRENIEWLGRFMGRLHAVGGMYAFEHRTQLIDVSLLKASQDLLLQGTLVPEYLQQAYQTVTDDILALLTSAFDNMTSVKIIRLHGDCHAGNILWTSDGPHFVDFDDCCSGPAIQDIWMLLSGDVNEMGLQLSWLLRSYMAFCDFDLAELKLIEVLRTMRILNYSAWVAKRWHDPAFPQNFPWFDTPRYWEEHIETLREQLYKLNDVDYNLQVDLS